MPEAVGHNVWSKERGRRDSGYDSVVLRQNSGCTSAVYTGLSWERGVEDRWGGGKTAYTQLCSLSNFPPARSLLCDTQR